MDRIFLTGALLTSTQVANITRVQPTPGESGLYPFSGDIRLDIQLDSTLSRLPEGPLRCQGSCLFSIFDGTSWRRLDIATLTTNYRFKNRDQLLALERWLRQLVALSAGRGCEWSLAVAQGTYHLSAADTGTSARQAT